MVSSYPTTFDVLDEVARPSLTHKDVADAVTAIEQTLGLTPAGTNAVTIVERLDEIDQAIQAKADADWPGSPGNNVCFARWTSAVPQPPRPTSRTDILCIWVAFPAGVIPANKITGDLIAQDLS